MVDRPAALGYRPALDGVRAIAIAGVIAYHVLPSNGGYLGVHLFFVLSGFLITTLLLEERDRTGTISLRRFYARRALRLLPALAVALAFVTLVYMATGRAAEAGRSLLAGGLYAGN